MNIVVFTGGTGSTSLQKGLHEVYGDKLNLTLITNAYDNGLSTGAVRKVLGGSILGPSDVRKNQFTQAKLRNSEFEDLMEFLKILDLRFSKESAAEMKTACLINFKLFFSKFDSKSIKWVTVKTIINNAIEAFFSIEDSKLIEYSDFSVANIIYAGVAYKNNFSLAKASKFIASNVLRIPEDIVLLSSDNSLYLQAITENGIRILDEGDIVNWNNPGDPIVDIELVDIRNNTVTPELSSECRMSIANADVIIFSSGTQWSSLIPTYKHNYFYESIKNSIAKKYLVMNNTPDKDMLGKDSKAMLDILKNYLPSEDITVIYNTMAPSDMRQVHPDFKSIESNMNRRQMPMFNSKHDGDSLALCIMRDFYKEYLEDKDYFMFDFDDTLVGRRSSYKNESKENLKYFHLLGSRGVIVTGNSQKHIHSQLMLNEYDAYYNDTGNIVCCDGGNSYCKPGVELLFTGYIDDQYIINNNDLKDLYEDLIFLGVPIYKLENRNSLVVTIKPLSSERRLELIKEIKLSVGDKFDVNIAGLTSIDICKKGYDKSVILRIPEYSDANILYVGDELDHGNDAVMKKFKNITTFSVDNPKDTNILLTTLMYGKTRANYSHSYSE